MLEKTLLLLLTFCCANAFAYPHFIGKGYHNCLTCHYNPFGNGPLNDYGRGVAASGLAGRLLIPKTVGDEKLSNISGFLFNKQDKQFLKPSLDYRGGNVYTALETENSQDKWINMQLDASLSAVFGSRKEYVTTFTYSFVPANSLPNGKAEYEVDEGEDLVYSREHYFGMKSTKSLSFYIGKMDKVFGIRVPEHTAYSRLRTGNDQYGASHGALVHFYKQNFDLGLHIYIGDLEKTEQTRYQGASSKFEFTVNDKFRPGVSLLKESNETNERLAYSLQSKFRVGKASSILSEVGRVSNTPEGGEETIEQYVFLQNHYYINRGLYFVTTYENWKPNAEEERLVHKFAPGLLYFPLQRVELRADLYNTKEYAQNSATKDSWSLIGQLHLWF